MRILFTSVGRRVELLQAFRSAAIREAIPLTIYGADYVSSAPALLFCDRAVIVPAIKDDSYIPFLLQYCRNEAIDCLVPTIDTDLMKLAESKHEFEAVGTKVLIAGPEKVAICRDKRLTSAYFNSLGLKAPRPYDNIQEVKFLLETGELSFPLFIKPKDGSSSKNAFKADSIDDLYSFSERIGEYIIQPYVRGVEYTVDIFCDYDGNPVFITPRKRLAVRSGEVLKTEICLDNRIFSEMRVLINDFKPSGAITVQLIREENSGDDYYIEINPRFGGGAPLSMKAGADSAIALLDVLSGKQPSKAEILNGAIYSRFDQSVCVNMNALNSKIEGVIFDLDDTLYNEIDYVKSGFRQVSQFLGDPNYYGQLLSIFQRGGKPIDELLESIGRLEEKASCLDCYRNHFPEIRLEEGTVHLLEELRQRGFKLGIITDGRPAGQWNKIKALGLDKVVDDIIVTDELGGAQFRKPCDIAFRMMQLRWKIQFSSLAYIGDNPTKDFVAPMQLGMHSFLIQNSNSIHSQIIDSVFKINRLANILSVLNSI